MSDVIHKFIPKISDIELINGELRFILSGDDNYGFDKSLVNSIRRTILTDIPTVAFKTSEIENNDINMIINNTSIHNEMLIHRLSLIPLYLDPENYMKNHLFECNVKHNGKEPYQFISTANINIYPLKSGFIERIDNLFDELHDTSEEDERILRQQLSELNIENYDLDKPLSDKEKKQIFKPFNFRNIDHYSLITELKSTNTENKFQELHFYGSPSVGFGRDHACFQPVSQSNYSFQINDSLVNDVLSEKIKIENIDKDEIDDYSRKFKLSESERYFYRDKMGESNRYQFSIKSNHFYDEGTLFKKAIEILKQKYENLKLEFINLLKDNDSNISYEKKNDLVYHFEILNESHTIGNLLQSHIIRRYISSETLINSCGYKKIHPLEEKLLLIITINPSHKLSNVDEVNKIQNIISSILECIDSIIQDIRILSKVSEKSF